MQKPSKTVQQINQNQEKHSQTIQKNLQKHTAFSHSEDITYRLKEASEMLTTIIETQPKETNTSVPGAKSVDFISLHHWDGVFSMKRYKKISLAGGF